MEYYFIKNSLDLKIMGKYPQVKDVKYHCDVWNNKNFIDNIHFQKIDSNPIVANPILHSKSKLTDLIYLWNVGFTYTKLISGKLKSILSNYVNEKAQFIQCSVYKDNVEHHEYWLLSVYKFNQENIDFENSIIRYDKHADDFETSYETNTLFLNISSLQEFEKYNKIAEMNKEILFVEKLCLNKSINEDFFALKDIDSGVGYLVSEKLKQEIEEAGCTGIEFQPSELSYNEWTAPGGEREKVYGKA